MTAKIEVAQTAPEEFRVRITGGVTETTHLVTMKTKDYDRISARKVEPAELVRRAFEFLLAREPNTSIVREFDLMVIAKYFSDFERVIKRNLPES